MKPQPHSQRRQQWRKRHWLSRVYRQRDYRRTHGVGDARRAATTPKLLFTARIPARTTRTSQSGLLTIRQSPQGNETVSYDESNPLNSSSYSASTRRHTTASDIIAALAADPVANQLFCAENSSGNNGSGVVSVNDTAYTSGGTLRPASGQTYEIMLKQVLDVINHAAADKLQASVGANNNLVLTDLTTDGGLRIQSRAAQWLARRRGSGPRRRCGRGHDQRAGDCWGGSRRRSLNSLNGGKGFGDARPRSTSPTAAAAAAQIDLSAVETLDDILEAINTAGIGVSARVNDARNGILLADTIRRHRAT